MLCEPRSSALERKMGGIFSFRAIYRLETDHEGNVERILKLESQVLARSAAFLGVGA